MFMGTYNNSIDGKNRMIVPSKHRDQLGGRCILTKGIDNCLNIYTLEDWEKQLEKISSLPESDPQVRAFVRHLCGNAVECEFDKQGRINIPQELKDYASITKELVTIGAMRKIEVWSKEVWTSQDNPNKLTPSQLSSTLAQYNF